RGALWFLPLMAPELLLAPFSQYLEIGLSTSRHVADVAGWYYAPAYPFLVAAFTYGIVRLSRLADLLARRLGPPYRQRAGRVTVAVVVTGILATNCGSMLVEALARPRCFEGFVRHEPSTGGGARLALYLYYLARLGYLREWAWRIEQHLARVPANAPVSAQYPFLVALAWRDRISLFPDIEGAAVVVIHRSLANYPWTDDRAFRQEVWTLRDSGFRLAAEEGGLLIFEHVPGSPAASTLNDPVLCLDRCWRYEAEELPEPPRSDWTPSMSCRWRDSVDRSASGLAARMSSWSTPL